MAAVGGGVYPHITLPQLGVHPVLKKVQSLINAISELKTEEFKRLWDQASEKDRTNPALAHALLNNFIDLLEANEDDYTHDIILLMFQYLPFDPFELSRYKRDDHPDRESFLRQAVLEGWNDCVSLLLKISTYSAYHCSTSSMPFGYEDFHALNGEFHEFNLLEDLAFDNLVDGRESLQRQMSDSAWLRVCGLVNEIESNETHLSIAIKNKYFEIIYLLIILGAPRFEEFVNPQSPLNRALSKVDLNPKFIWIQASIYAFCLVKYPQEQRATILMKLFERGTDDFYVVLKELISLLLGSKITTFVFQTIINELGEAIVISLNQRIEEVRDHAAGKDFFNDAEIRGWLLNFVDEEQQSALYAVLSKKPIA